MIDRREFITAGILAATGLLINPRSWSASTGPVFYRVVAGDTLGEIALRHNISVEQLKRINGLSSQVIYAGQNLKIPGGFPALPVHFFTKDVRSVSQNLKPVRRHWQMIVIHHSAVDRGNALEYDAAHRKRGMKNGLAYHFVIGNGRGNADGAIEMGRRWRQQLAGGHVRRESQNKVAIGICLVGNFENYDPTRKQLSSLEELLNYLQSEFLPRPVRVVGHRDLDRTLCPGRYFPMARLLKAQS
jgi:LysM repeat protein